MFTIIRIRLAVKWIGIIVLCTNCKAIASKPVSGQSNRIDEKQEVILTDSLHKIALHNFVSNSNYTEASIYMIKHNIGSGVRKQFIDFLLDGAGQNINASYSPGARGLSVNLEKRDLSSDIRNRLINLLEKDTLISYLYPVAARLDLVEILPMLRAKFSRGKNQEVGQIIWDIATGLAIWEEEEAIDFILDTCKEKILLDRRAVYSYLLPNILNIQSKRITEFIITEFILTNRCHDYDDPGVVPWCETEIALKIVVIQEFNQFLETFSENQKPSNREIRRWFTENQTNWTYTENRDK